MLIRFWRDRRGNFAVLSAIMMVSLAGVGGLVADYGNGLFNRLKDQRLADTAAVAGARIYDETQSPSAVTTAVANVAALNGVTTGVTASIVNSPSGDGNQAVKVIVTSRAPRYLSRLLMGPALSYIPVAANSYAEMKPGGAGCVIALSADGTGVTTTGSGSISAPSCAVASNQTITCLNQTTITTDLAYYNGSLPSCPNLDAPGGGQLTPTHAYTPDPLAGTSEVLGQTGRLSAVAGITSPSPPTVPAGTSLAFTSSNNSGVLATLVAQSCTGTLAGSVWTITCTSGTHSFGTISVASGTTLNFNVSGSSSNIYNFTQVHNLGGTMNFGSGAFNVAQGILADSGSSTTTTFGAGTFNVGAYTSTCNGHNSPTNDSICNLGPTMTFAGPSTFVLAGAIYVKASTALTMGSSGSTNSFKIGKDSNGDSLYLGSSATVITGDATGNSDLFQMAGNLDLPNGESCMKLGAAAQHDINGFFLTAGGSILGSGVYTVTNYMALGGSNGGDSNCGSLGNPLGMSATNVTFVIGGSALFTGDSQNCPSPGCSFYLGAGYSSVTLIAPSTGTTQGLAVIGPTSSSNTGRGSFTEGSTNASISGAFYFPYAPIVANGHSGINVGNGSGQCLEMIGAQVSITNGGAMASTCNIPGVGNAGTSGLVSLVQ